MPSSTAAPSSSEDDILLSTLALPAQTGVVRFIEPYSEDDDDDIEEETPALEDLEEDSSQSSDITADDSLPKRESGLTEPVVVAEQKWSKIVFY